MIEEPKSYEEILKSEGKLIALNSGTSMMPLLRQGRDVMVIERRGKERLKKYDPVLYKSDGRYVLHRIIEVRPDDYVIVGDNCRIKEYGIKDEDILGKLTGVIRNGKREIKTDGLICRIYAHLWVDFFPIRAGIIYVRQRISSILRRIKNHL